MNTSLNCFAASKEIKWSGRIPIRAQDFTVINFTLAAVYLESRDKGRAGGKLCTFMFQNVSMICMNFLFYCYNKIYGKSNFVSWDLHLQMLAAFYEMRVME